MALVDHIAIENFRCVAHAAFDVAPFTVFVGANGSGKSSLLAAFDARKIGDQANAEDPSSPTIVGWKGDEGASVARRLPGGGQKFAARGPDVITLQLTLSSLRAENRTSSELRLASSGGNLPNVLASLGRNGLTRLAGDFCRLVPIFRDVDVRPSPIVGHHRVLFQDRWNEDRWYTQSEVSDGSLIMLALLAAFAQPKPPDILAIDEIERGLHPYLLQQVVALCRELAAGKLGRPVQVLAATHSPHLLDFLEPHEVRFVTRDRDTGNTVVTAPPTEAPEWARAPEAYRDSLGDLWLSGALGGAVGR
ncbi:MAG: AAA family ATPase [Deltaproteobacteria bacterium]